VAWTSGGPTAERPPWSRRRRRLLRWLAAGAVLAGVGVLVLPGEYGVTSGFVAALCAFLLVVAVIVFVAIPGPDTFGALLRTAPLAGSVLVVAVLLVLSTAGESLRWLWVLAAVLAAGWTAFAVWENRRSGL
jgi:drug/metabolite transporter (DMT)-like permease